MTSTEDYTLAEHYMTLAARFREIEQTYGVGIVYGRRKFVQKATGVISTRPGRAPVAAPLSHTSPPLTKTFDTPAGSAAGSLNVD